jgi:amino acid adenylation domain-containing protein
MTQPMLLHHFFESTVARVPDKVALVAGAQRYTYRDLATRVTRLAASLQRFGVKRGDRVIVFADNGVEAVVAIYAALKAGGVFVPVNPVTRSAHLAFLLNDCRAAGLVSTEALRGAWEPALAKSPSVLACVVSNLRAAGAGGRLQSYEEATGGLAGESQPISTIDQDLASILYTSGSTGEPKGVMLTHLNMVSAARSVNSYLGMTGDDVILCALPLAFGYGLYQILIGFLLGATVVLERSFSFPVRTLQTMVKEGVTVFPGVPTMFSMILGLQDLAEFDLRRLRMITNAAAALSERHIRELRARFPQAALFSMYGLTECKRVTYLPPDQLDLRPTSVGRGMPNQELWLVDEQGRRLPNGSTGELVIRGSHVMRGYWERPEETAQRLRPGPNPGEMLLYSGDVFRTDEEGFLYFVSRKDHIIKSRGEKVSPNEVENVLYSLDGVQDAAVIGVPDEILGQAIKAFVVLRPGCMLDERDLLRHCQEELEPFRVPKYIAIVPELPRTGSGKITKIGLA